MTNKNYENVLPKFSRPDTEEYFLMMAVVAASRSKDLFVKHGSIMVDSISKHIIGTGYNGPVRGKYGDKIDQTNRDKRRPFMLHAEENCILNSSCNPLESNRRVSIYSTGQACLQCTQRIINFGVSEIYFLERIGSITMSPEDLDAFNEMTHDSGVDVIRVLPTDRIKLIMEICNV